MEAPSREGDSVAWDCRGITVVRSCCAVRCETAPVKSGRGESSRRDGIAAVVFDLYITLTDFEAERRRPEFAIALAGELGVAPEAFLELMRLTFDERASGVMGDIRSTLLELARRLNAEPSDTAVNRAVARRRQQELHISTPRKGSIAVLRDLRARGYKVGLISDCTPELIDLWTELPYDDVIDAAVFSCELGCRKPAAALYEELARRIGVPPAQCLYVGDGSSGELTGAARVGMFPVMIDTPFASDFRYDAEPEWHGAVISDLADVIPLLAAQAEH